LGQAPRWFRSSAPRGRPRTKASAPALS